MDVQFRRTGERRYAVTILRAGEAPLEMNPAPGYDPLMPHDLLHFVVERELGLQQGIFGQIAAGGHAGTFHIVAAENGNRREAARRRRREAKRGDKLLSAGRDEAVLSEHATYICLYEWLSRSNDPTRREIARQLAPSIAPAWQAAAESLVLTETRISQICERMEDLSQRWAALRIGESFTVNWPVNNRANRRNAAQ